MDLRRPVLAIVVGGSPAPGINGVIAATTLEAIACGFDVIGFMEGFKRLREGKSKVVEFTVKDVLKIQKEGGSVLRTSKMQPNTQLEIDNVLRVLEQHRVRYLVAIGGVMTAQSTTKVAAAAAKNKIKLSIVHVPKTIFNDIPLPGGARTFGFNTARQVGHDLVTMFAADAATMVRWYILTCVGVQSGHLTLGIAKSAAANLTLIPEMYANRKGKPLKFSELVDTVEATMYKRRAEDQNQGVVMLCEGLVECLDAKEMKELFGNVDDGHQDLGRQVAQELKKRFAKKGGGLETITVVARNIGTECRAADPSAEDILLARDLGYGAVHYLMEGGNGAMITLKEHEIYPIPLTDLVDEKTGATEVRVVDVNGVHFRVAAQYMTRLRRADLSSRSTLVKLASAAGLTIDEFLARFAYVADEEDRKGAGGSALLGSAAHHGSSDDLQALHGGVGRSGGGWASPPTSNPLMLPPSSASSTATAAAPPVSATTAAAAAAFTAAQQHAVKALPPHASSPSPQDTPTSLSPASASPVGPPRKLDAKK